MIISKYFIELITKYKFDLFKKLKFVNSSRPNMFFLLNHYIVYKLISDKNMIPLSK